MVVKREIFNSGGTAEMGPGFSGLSRKVNTRQQRW